MIVYGVTLYKVPRNYTPTSLQLCFVTNKHLWIAEKASNFNIGEVQSTGNFNEPAEINWLMTNAMPQWSLLLVSHIPQCIVVKRREFNIASVSSWEKILKIFSWKSCTNLQHDDIHGLQNASRPAIAFAFLKNVLKCWSDFLCGQLTLINLHYARALFCARTCV